MPLLAAIRRHFNRANLPDTVLSLVLIAALAGAVAALSYSVAKPVTEPFTEFYLLGPKGQAADYPTEIRTGADTTITVGVVNRENEEAEYRLALQVNGAPAQLILGGERLDEVSPIVLADKEKWEEQVHFVPQTPGRQQKFEFLLFRQGDAEPYLTTHIWVDVL